MKKYLFSVILGISVSFLCARDPVLPCDAGSVLDGFICLFNGETLDGWKALGEGRNAWSVQNGTILMEQFERARGWLEYEHPYRDFVFTCEWKADKGANSGIFLRIPDRPGVDPTWDAIEIQISDDENYDIFYVQDNPGELSGAIYGIAAPCESMFRGIGVWNRYVITCIGSHLILEYNGRVVLNVDARDHDKSFDMWGETRTAFADRPGEGFVGLQVHKGSRVWFRNIAIKDLTVSHPDSIDVNQ